MPSVRLPSDLQAAMQASDRYKQKMRVEDPERYEREFGHETRITNRLSLTDVIRNNFLSIGTAARDPQKARAQEIDRLYNSLMNGARKATTMTESQFLRFAPLYNVEYRQKTLDGTLTNKEDEMLASLSEELYRIIDVTEPLTIVADADHKKVVEVLPPIYMKLNIRPAALNNAMQEFSSAAALDDGVAGGITNLQIKRATRNVALAMSKNQDWNDLTNQFRRAQQIRLQFNKHRGLDQNHPLVKQGQDVAQKIAQSRASNDSDNADDLDFEPIE